MKYLVSANLWYIAELGALYKKRKKEKKEKRLMMVNRHAGGRYRR